MGTQITEGLGQAWAMVATFVPKLLGFLLVLFIGWLIAKALAKAVGFLLKRVGFGRLVERSGLGGDKSPIDASGVIVKIVYYFVLLIALQLAFGVFGTGNAVSVLLNDVIAYLPRIVVAIILVLVAAAIGKALKGLVSGALGDRPYTKILGNITYGFIVALGVIAALNQLGIAVAVTMPVLIAVLATVAGVIIIGVGGGLVRPMQQRWEGWLNKIQEESAHIAPTPRREQEPVTAGAGRASARAGQVPQTPPAGMAKPPAEGR
ncbi:mechanosensitive ion channel family protein [Saccharothrix isguenensis]